MKYFPIFRLSQDLKFLTYLPILFINTQNNSNIVINTYIKKYMSRNKDM